MMIMRRVTINYLLKKRKLAEAKLSRGKSKHFRSFLSRNFINIFNASSQSFSCETLPRNLLPVPFKNFTSFNFNLETIAVKIILKTLT